MKGKMRKWDWRIAFLIAAACSLGCGKNAQTDFARKDQAETVGPPKPAEPKVTDGPPITDPPMARILFATCSDAGVLTVAVEFIQLDGPQAYLYLPDASFGCGIGGDVKASLDDGKLVLDLSYYPRKAPPAVTEWGGPPRMQGIPIGKPGNDGAVRVMTYTFCFPLTATDKNARRHVVDLPEWEIPVEMVFGFGTEHPNEFRRRTGVHDSIELNQKWLEWQRQLTTTPYVVKFPTKKPVSTRVP